MKVSQAILSRMNPDLKSEARFALYTHNILLIIS